MEKFFRKTLYLGIILCIAALAGCQNPFERPEEASVPRGRGRVVVTIGASADGSARTIAPDTTEFAKITSYTLTFSGPEAVDPVEIGQYGGGGTAVDLPAGSWTISAVGYMRKGGENIAVAEGSAPVKVSDGSDAAANIVLGPSTGGSIRGTLGYSVELDVYKPDKAEIIINTAEGVAVNTITLVREASLNSSGEIDLGINTGAVSLDPGEYMVRIRLEKKYGGDTKYAGFTEVVHIYPGLTSVLPERELNDEDFFEAFSDLDLTNVVTAPVAWATPQYGFPTNHEQYWGDNDHNSSRITWMEEDGVTPVTGIFGRNKVYKAVVRLVGHNGYTHFGVAENSYTHAAATEVTNKADVGVVVGPSTVSHYNYGTVFITFPPTANPAVTGVMVTAASPSVPQGEQVKFRAEVKGELVDPPDTVTWTVSGNRSAGTFIAADGILHAAIDESAVSLTVRGTSIADDTMYDDETVTVTPTEYIEIDTEAELAMIGVDPAYPLGGKYRLTADLTLSDWVPIGDKGRGAPFLGIFDGNGRTITLQGFAAAALEESSLGIFGYVKGNTSESKAILKDLNIVSSVNAVSSSKSQSLAPAIGLLAGYAENAEISDITLSGSLEFFAAEKFIYAGGIVGYISRSVFWASVTEGTVVPEETILKNCSGTLDITTTQGGDSVVVGGFVGEFEGGDIDIINCHNTGSITALVPASVGSIYCGGIIGRISPIIGQGKIEGCSYAGTIKATVTGSFGVEAGGIAGYADLDTSIIKCRAEGTVSGNGRVLPSVGGIAGTSRGTIAQSYFNGTVKVSGGGGTSLNSTCAGGIAGTNSVPGRIEDCWSHGQVTGVNTVGGIAGRMAGQPNASYTTRSYSTAAITRMGIDDANNSTGAGGIAGSARTMGVTDVTISACVALNSAISGGGAAKDMHRVVGNTDDPAAELISILDNNHAWSGIVITPSFGTGKYTAKTGAGKADGASITTQPGQAFYEGLGWDFAGVWAMDSYGYPKLKWQATEITRAPLGGTL
jgi:hypothetical protein